MTNHEFLELCKRWGDHASRSAPTLGELLGVVRDAVSSFGPDATWSGCDDGGHHSCGGMVIYPDPTDCSKWVAIDS